MTYVRRDINDKIKPNVWKNIKQKLKNMLKETEQKNGVYRLRTN